MKAGWSWKRSEQERERQRAYSREKKNAINLKPGFSKVIDENKTGTGCCRPMKKKLRTDHSII